MSIIQNESLLNEPNSLKQKQYWMNKLMNCQAKTSLQYDIDKVASKDMEIDFLHLDIKGNIFDKMDYMSKGSDLSVYLMLQTCVKILLYKYNAINDVIVTSPSYIHEDNDCIYGNLLPLWDQIDSSDSFKECLFKIKNTTLEAYENQGYPVNLILDELNINCITNIACIMTNIHEADSTTDLQADLVLQFSKKTDSIKYILKYNTKVYKKYSIELFAKRFLVLLTKILNQPSIRIKDIKIMTSEERQLLLYDFNKNEKSFPYNKTWHEIFAEQVVLTPDHTAVIYNDQKLTYKELDAKSNQVSRLLREKGVTRGTLVGILCNRSIGMLVSIIAVFKAGGAYIPIDVKYPVERIKTILLDSNTEYLITKNSDIEDKYELYSEIALNTNIRHVLCLDNPEDSSADKALLKTFRLAAMALKGQISYLSQKPDLYFEKKTIEFEEYINKAQKLKQFIVEKKLNNGCLVAILLSNPINQIIASIALKELDTPFCLIDNNLKIEQKKSMVKTEKIEIIISEKTFLDEVDQILWETEYLSNYIIIDEYDIHESIKEDNFKQIWEAVATETTEEINDYGWNNSYTGERFTIAEMNQYINNFRSKIQPHINSDSKVFEIGCGHGLVLFEIAPKVKEYFATDISKMIIEKNQLRAKKENMDHIHFEATTACDIGSLNARDYDVVICSSVIHYFPNSLYLEQVIKNAINIIGDEGVIYLDDIMDINKKEELISSTVEYKKSNPNSRTKTEWNNDLFVHAKFFTLLQNKYPEIEEIQVSNKIGKIENELTKFRYDVLLRINKKSQKNKEKVFINKNRYTLEDFQNCYGYSMEDTDVDCTIDEQSSNEDKMIVMVCLDDIKNTSSETIDNINEPSDLCYVIYTSGSTGKPKGAMIEHVGMMNHMYAKINDLKITQDTIIAQNASQCFDISVWQFLSALLVGGRVVIYSNETVKDMQEFIYKNNQDKITIMQVVPSYLVAMLNHLEYFKTDFPYLDCILVTGEEVKATIVEQWFQSYPNIKMVNAYGPTEASDDITHYIMSESINSRLVPVGKPIQNLKIYIIDENERLCPLGIIGEICVAGIGVGRGYLNDLEKTNLAFKHISIENEEVRIYKTGDLGKWLYNGNLQYLGRKDNQIKIRGFRIELGEIESRLAEITEIKEVTVLCKYDENGGRLLVAYYVSNTQLNIDEIKQRLTNSLPEHMIPSYFVKIDKMPLTPNGKTDRKALYEVCIEMHNESSYAPPRNEVEGILANIWKEVLLTKNDIGINDNFFELGGDSIIAIQIASKAQRHNLKVSVQALFTHSTISKLSAHVENLNIGTTQDNVSGTAQLTPIQKEFFTKITTDINHYNQSLMLFRENGFEYKYLEDVINKLVRHHDQLRTVFQRTDSGIVQLCKEYDNNIIDIKQYNLMDIADYREAIVEHSNKLQSSINLEEGPLMKVALFNSKDGDYLLIIIHHLLIDGVSWRILIEDLAKGYKQLEDSKEVIFPLKTTSFIKWSEGLAQYSRSEELLEEIEYWKEVSCSAADMIIKDNKIKENKMADRSMATVNISEEYTDKLLKTVPKVYHTEINDILLSGLIMAFKVWNKNDKLVIDLEAHGREEIIKEVDVTRTIGWFTSIYPIVLHVEDLNDIEKTVQETKNTLRRVPRKGIGYGILKYITPKEYTKALKFELKPDVSFNFMGQANGELNGDVFQMASAPRGNNLSDNAERLYPIEILCGVYQGELKINIEYNKKQFEQDDICNLAESYRKKLMEIIASCVDEKLDEEYIEPYSDKDLDKEDIEGFFRDVDELFTNDTCRRGTTTNENTFDNLFSN